MLQKDVVNERNTKDRQESSSLLFKKLASFLLMPHLPERLWN